MTAVKNVAQMVLALPEFKSVNAANYPFSSGTAQPTEYGPSALGGPMFVQCASSSSSSDIIIDSDIIAGGCLTDHILNFRNRLFTNQLDLNFVSIKLDRALVLDKGSFTRNNYARVVNDSDLFVLNSLVDEFFLASNYQRTHREKYLSVLNMLVANLLQALLLGKLLLVSRHKEPVRNNNPSNIDNRLVTRLCDWLSAEGYISLVVQPRQSRGNTSFAQSVVYLNEKLRTLVFKYRVIQSGSPVIIRVVEKEEIKQKDSALHSDKKSLIGNKKAKKKPKKYKFTKVEIKVPETKAVQLKYKSHVGVLNDYFAFASGVLFTLGDAELSPYGRRIFNNTIELGGRFYANYQNVPSHDRKRIQINHQKTTELDYKSLHFNILYSMAGVKLVGDPYIVDGYDRDVIKLISLQLLNTEGENGLNHLGRMITRSGKPEQIKAFEKYAYQLHIYNIDVSRGLRVTPPYKPLSLNHHIHSIPEGTDGKQLVSDLLERHKAIRHLIGGKDIGLRLQNTDSNIMKDIMRTATSESIPLLFVHDSCICKYSDRARVKQIMIETYKSFTGFNIKVTQ